MLLDTLVEILTHARRSRRTSSKRRRSALVGAIRQQQDQPSVRAYEEAMRRIYPPAHPFHRLTRRGADRPRRGPAARRTSSAFYEERYGAGTLRLVVVGDVEADRILDRLEEGFGAWRAGPRAADPACRRPAARAGRARRSACPTRRAPTSCWPMPADLRRTDPDYLACVARQLGARAVLADVAPRACGCATPRG